MPEGCDEVSEKHDTKRRPRVEDLVERDIDGMWFPAKVIAVRESVRRGQSSGREPAASKTLYDLVYLDDNNNEFEVPEEDLRLQSDALHTAKAGEKVSTTAVDEKERGSAGGAKPSSVPAASSDWAKKTGVQPTPTHDDTHEAMRRDVDDNGHHLSQDAASEPKVTIHSSNATFDAKEDGSATAYIINGPETNVAAGSGLRGIRWLRG